MLANSSARDSNCRPHPASILCGNLGVHFLGVGTSDEGLHVVLLHHSDAEVSLLLPLGQSVCLGGSSLPKGIVGG